MIDLEAIKARVEAATPGPWAIIPPDEYSDRWFICRDRLGAPIGTIPEHLLDDRSYFIAIFGDLMPADNAQGNAEFFTHAREDVPALVAEVERLRELLRYVDLQACGDHLLPGIANEDMIRVYLNAGKLREIAEVVAK